MSRIEPKYPAEIRELSTRAAIEFAWTGRETRERLAAGRIPGLVGQYDVPLSTVYEWLRTAKQVQPDTDPSLTIAQMQAQIVAEWNRRMAVAKRRNSPISQLKALADIAVQVSRLTPAIEKPGQTTTKPSQSPKSDPKPLSWKEQLEAKLAANPQANSEQRQTQTAPHIPDRPEAA